MPRFARAPRAHRIRLTPEAIEIRFGFYAPAWVEWMKRHGARMGPGRVWTLQRTRGNARALLEHVERGTFRISPADRAAIEAAGDHRAPAGGRFHAAPCASYPIRIYSVQRETATLTRESTMYQIENKLRRAGVNLEGVTFTNARELEIAVLDADGDLDFDATLDRTHEVSRVLGFGGFRCAGGHWVLRKGYSAGPAIDFCDPASPNHY